MQKPIENEDFKTRADSFFKKYGEIVNEFDVDFANYPMFVPDEKGGFRVIIQSTPVDMKLQKLNQSFVAKDA